MIKYEITVTFKNETKRAEIVTAPDVVTALMYGLNKYGQYKVHAMRYYGPEEAVKALKST